MTNTIKINVQKGTSVGMNATSIGMSGVETTVSGGEISSNAKNSLVQIGNTMNCSNGGLIKNEVGEGGSLHQIGNKMTADSKGKIINSVGRSSLLGLGVLAVVGFSADIITLLVYGKNVWDYLL